MSDARRPEHAPAPRGGELRAVRTRINGEEGAFEAGARDMALEILRDVAGLTGTKVVCGAGAYGACTIELDGTPVVSCLLPAHSLDGRSIRTVEGLSGAGRGAGEVEGAVGARSELHPVQKAFMAADGLQCGFCTPGYDPVVR